MTSAAGAQPQLRAVVPAVEVRHARPVGVPVELESREVRIRRLASIPASDPFGEHRRGHQDLSVRQSGAIGCGLRERILGGFALIAVRIEGHPADAGLVFDTLSQSEVLGVALQLLPAPLGQASRRNDEVPPAVEGAAKALHTTLIREHDGQKQHFGLGARGEVGHGGDVGRPKALLSTMQFEEGRDLLDLSVHRRVPRRGREAQWGGLVFDDVLQGATNSDGVESSVQEPILDEPQLLDAPFDIVSDR